MCNFFSFITCPDLSADKYYFDWEMRKKDWNGADNHSHICAHYRLSEDLCNKYEYNPLTCTFFVDMINAKKDDSENAERWVKNLDWKTIVAPLIIKPIINPIDLPKVERPTLEQIGWLEEWASVGASVRASVRASVWASVGASVGNSIWTSVGDSVWASVGDSVGNSVGASVGDSVWAYVGSFFDVQYDYDFSSAVKLWAEGLVPSSDGTTWRLHSGGKAEVVHEQSIRGD